MIDFNTILSAAITASINTAIEQAVAPLKEQIAALQHLRLTALETNAHPQQNTFTAEQLMQLRAIIAEQIVNIGFVEEVKTAITNSSVVEDAVENHLNNYDFSDIISDNIEIHIESQLENYDFRSIVSDVLEDARITL